jgi:hypothetical protein
MARRGGGDFEVRIGDLAIEGFSPADGRRVAEALGRELALALARGGGPPFVDAPPGRSITHERLDAGPVVAPPGGSPQAVGRAAARAVARGLRRLAAGGDAPTRRDRP